MPVLYTVHTHTRILKPFEDSDPTGLKVDIADFYVFMYLSAIEPFTFYIFIEIVYITSISFSIEMMRI